MTISAQALQDFEEIWRSENPDEKISRADLEKLAIQILYLVKLLYCSNKKV